MKLLPVKNIAASAARPLVEPLEQRRLFADTFSLFPDPGLIYGPVRPPPGPRAPEAAINIRKAASTVGPSINLFDITFKDNHPTFERSLWVGVTPWSTAGTTTLDASQARVEKLASYVRDGRTEPWTKQKVRQNSLTILDFESPQLSQQAPEFFAQRLRWFTEAAPGAPVTSFGISIGAASYSREQLHTPTPQEWSGMLADARKYAVLVEQMDVIPVNMYMLGKSFVERDIGSFATVARALRTVYPTKPIVAIAWGAYHTSWNPAHSVFSDDVTQQYVRTIRTYFDGAFIWGPAEDNVKLFTAFSSKSDRTRLAPQSSGISEIPGTKPVVNDSPRSTTVGEGIGLITDTGTDELIS